jgi:hypothetical protein
MIPPGPSPGTIIFASAPATSPTMIQLKMLMYPSFVSSWLRCVGSMYSHADCDSHVPGTTNV